MIKKALFAAGLCLAAHSATAGSVDGQIYARYDATGNQIGSTVDHLRFTVGTDGIVKIDILSWESDPDTDAPRDVNGDGEIAFLDTYLYLFRDDGSLDSADYIAHNDDSDETKADGSIWRTDSYLELNLAAGNYLLAVGAYDLGLDEAILGENRDTFYPIRCDIAGPDCASTARTSDHGDYRVSFSSNVSLAGDGKIPEPAALGMLGLGMAGLALWRGKKA
jgi:hypothetical protein